MADDPLSDIPSASAPAQSASDPLADIPKADTSMQDAYHEASQYNPDDVAKAQGISKKTGVDPNYSLANIKDLQHTENMPDFDVLKITNPATYKAMQNNMGTAWDDPKNLIQIEDHAKVQKQAESILDAMRAGYQGSVRGLEIRHTTPDFVLGPKAPFSHEVAAAATGMVLDLPETVVGGVLGSVAGPFGAGAGGFALPAMMRTALTEEFTHGSIDSKKELLRRTESIGLAGAKQGAVGLAMTAAGMGATAAAPFLGLYAADAAGNALLGAEGKPVLSAAGKLLVKGAEVSGMTTAGAAVEGKKPTGKEFALNAIMLAGAHIAGITWEQMGKSAEASKLRARDSDAFASHADDVSGPAFVHVNAWDKEFGSDAQEQAEKLGLGSEYAAAKKSGGFITIPMSKALDPMMDAHREALKPDVKFDQ